MPVTTRKLIFTHFFINGDLGRYFCHIEDFCNGVPLERLNAAEESCVHHWCFLAVLYFFIDFDLQLKEEAQAIYGL